ncbi:MAG: hypothetical protein ACRDYX_07635, partial [Egibacteraceae bacterium]
MCAEPSPVACLCISARPGRPLSSARACALRLPPLPVPPQEQQHAERARGTENAAFTVGVPRGGGAWRLCARHTAARSVPAPAPASSTVHTTRRRLAGHEHRRAGPRQHGLKHTAWTGPQPNTAGPVTARSTSGPGPGHRSPSS